MSEASESDEGSLDGPTLAEITRRISAELEFYNGSLPKRTAVAWYAWMAGFVESGRLSLRDYMKLCDDLLPTIDVDQSLQKFLEPKEPDEHRLTLLRSPEATFEDVTAKFEADLEKFGGTVPELNNIAWSAYTSGLYEFGLLLLCHHSYFCDHLPTPEDDPVYAILVGRTDSWSGRLYGSETNSPEDA